MLRDATKLSAAISSRDSSEAPLELAAAIAAQRGSDNDSSALRAIAAGGGDDDGRGGPSASGNASAAIQVLRSLTKVQMDPALTEYARYGALVEFASLVARDSVLRQACSDEHV